MYIRTIGSRKKYQNAFKIHRSRIYFSSVIIIIRLCYIFIKIDLESKTANIMSKSAKIIHEPVNTFTDRRKAANETLDGISVRIETIETMLLLFDSTEENVLITIFKHLTEYVRGSDTNVELLKEVNALDILVKKEFYRSLDSVMVKRLALYLATSVIESTDTLKEYHIDRVYGILEACLHCYIDESDEFCVEYLTVIINKCLNDPQAVRAVLPNNEFLDEFFENFSTTTNPDTLYNSLELLEKMLLIQCTNELPIFVGHPVFPINRILCDITNDIEKIRIAALKVVNTLIKDANKSSPINNSNRVPFALEQLIQLFCNENVTTEEMELLIDVLSAALRNEHMTVLFFEMNLFQRFMARINDDNLPPVLVCRSLGVLAEVAAYPKYLEPLINSQYTEKLLHCFLNEITPTTCIVVGLNRVMKSNDATNIILRAYSEGLLPKILQHLPEAHIPIKTREQLAELLKQLLASNYYETAEEMITLKFPLILANIFAQPAQSQSIDLYLTSLAIIENLSQNADYREEVCTTTTLIESMGKLLSNAFSTSYLVSNIFRCLCCLIEEKTVRDTLLRMHILSSIKRGLKCRANTVKVAVTNFLMETARFPEFFRSYVNCGVLDILIFDQKHAFCVPTWASAIESILARDPTLKFCILNRLTFTDTTAGHDFFISKMRFEDFRDFLFVLEQEVSPLHPVLVMNFDRPENPPEYVIPIPPETLNRNELELGHEMCYCRRPGDPDLPLYVKELMDTFAKHGLTGNVERRCVDFESIGKRAKIIADLVARVLGMDLKVLDLNSNEDCSTYTVKCHLKELAKKCHTTFIPIGAVRTGCYFERALLFKGLADQVGLPCTLERSVNGRILYNQIPLPLPLEFDIHCHRDTMKFMPWRMLRPTHIVDLLYNVGEFYPTQGRDALQYLRIK